MELHWSSLFLGCCVLFHITVGQDFGAEHISMCNADSERTDEITVVGDSPHRRIKTECTCKVSMQGDPAGPSDFNVMVKDFNCARKCEWKLQVYVNGCKRFEACCDPAWSSQPIYLLRSHQFTPQTEVYVTHKNIINDQNGSMLEALILAVPLNNSKLPYTEFTTQCGYSFSDIQMQNSTQCISPTTTTSTSSSGSTAVPPATSSNNTEAPSVTDGNSNENNDLLLGGTLIAVIVGCAAAFIAILSSVIAIAVCLHKRKSSSSAASTTTSQRKIGDWLNDQQSEATGSVYSYSRNLPANQVPAPSSVPDSSERRYQPCFDPPPNNLYYKYADSYHA